MSTTDIIGLEAGLTVIYIATALGLIWAFINYKSVTSIDIREGVEDQSEDYKESVNKLQELGDLIHSGAVDFLMEEYKFCIGFLILMSVVLYFTVDLMETPYTTISFVVGGLTSIVSGYISMIIAVSTNYKVSFKATKSLAEAFRTAFGAGAAMGFCLVSIALTVLGILFYVYFTNICDGIKDQHITHMVETISGYGLGGSTVALFGRVGGGIYTKAADVGADLVGKVQQNLPEDDPRNPATIADNVGDNVGDVAGMGSDLFGSFAESTCAALIVSGTSLAESVQGPLNVDYLMYPMLITATGIIVCIFVSSLPVYFQSVKDIKQIEPTLKYQLVYSTISLTAGVAGIAFIALPNNFYISGVEEVRTPFHAFISTIIGLWSGLLIGYITEYYTSHSYVPVREVADACRTGAATNVIYGLALGYHSTFVPVVAICLSAYISHVNLGFYGVALAALGMLSNLPIGLTIDGYGPISDNAGGIAEMAQLPEEVREKTDALDAAGNTTAAIGKGFAIGSAALVSLALYGGYITRVLRWTQEEGHDKSHGLTSADVTDPLIFGGMLFGAMLPYLFSGFTMKSVGLAAKLMVENINDQIRNNPGILDFTSKPDYSACIKISTQASLKEMIKPGCLVIITPLVFGYFLGPKGIAGLLPGALISGIQMAISAANTGGAWDNAKKYVEAGNMYDEQGKVLGKGTDLHKAAVIGDTVGDPLKDTSGPSLNILVKLMAILSLVFAEFFCRTGILTRIIQRSGTQEFGSEPQLGVDQVPADAPAETPAG